MARKVKMMDENENRDFTPINTQAFEPLILKPGHYVVRSDRTLLCNVSNGQPQRFGGFGAAKAVAAALNASTLTVTLTNFAWGE